MFPNLLLPKGLFDLAALMVAACVLLLPVQALAQEQGQEESNYTSIGFESAIYHFTWMETRLFVNTAESLSWFDEEGQLGGKFCHRNGEVAIPLFSGKRGFYTLQCKLRKYLDFPYYDSLTEFQVVTHDWAGKGVELFNFNEKIVRNWVVSDTGILFMGLGNLAKDYSDMRFNGLFALDRIIAIDLENQCLLWEFKFNGETLFSKFSLLNGTQLIFVLEGSILSISTDGYLEWKQPFFDKIQNYKSPYPYKPLNLAWAPGFAGPGALGDHYWTVLNLDCLVIFDTNGNLNGIYQSPEAYYDGGYSLENSLVLSNFRGGGILSLFSLEEKEIIELPIPNSFSDKRNKAIEICGVIDDTLYFLKRERLRNAGDAREAHTIIYSWRIGLEDEPTELLTYSGVGVNRRIEFSEGNALLAVKQGNDEIKVFQLSEMIN